ncbi:zinc-binding dehydrogenase [Dactylosporangium sp. NPDC006015]|uniref:zinc-binding dehydrogenase n=1 Tax=Dactylosporangium sp. NPDC006015 TaxID=3154576 RepID=UPI0033B0CA69
MAGPHAGAGELAHLLVPVRGSIPYGCGQLDHLEAAVSGPAIAAVYGRHRATGTPPLTEVVARLRAGDRSRPRWSAARGTCSAAPWPAGSPPWTSTRPLLPRARHLPTAETWPSGPACRHPSDLRDDVTERRLVWPSPDRAQLQTIAQLVEAGRLIPMVDRTVPLAGTRAAYTSLETEHRRGKVVIDVAAAASR